MRKSSREGKSKGEVICWWDGIGETPNKERGGDKYRRKRKEDNHGDVGKESYF